MNLKRNLSLFWALLSFVLPLHAQQSNENLITVSFQDMPLSNAIKLIEQNSSYTFFYDASKIDVTQNVSLVANSMPIKEAVSKLLSDTNIRFEISSTQIVLFPNSKVIREQKNTPKKLISGKVVDEIGEPLIGVVISVKGKSEGVTTDINGYYSLEVGTKDELLFSYIGYNKKEYPSSVLGQGSHIILEPESKEITEVVVVGYGTQKKASIVGSISSIEPGKLSVSTTRSLSNDLAGNIGGIIAVQRSGEPGYDNSEFWIRGISSFKGTQKPLVLVDGIERSLDDIDISEIESFSVLKDASASAVYGVRGANGVIIITTKKGHVGKTKIEISVEHMITRPYKLPEFLNSANYLTLMNNIYIQEGLDPLYSDDIIHKYRSGYDYELYPDVNWIDAIMQDNAYSTRASMDLSGGSEKLRYSFVGAYFTEDGITVRDKSHEWDSSIKLHRFNLRTNVDVNVTSTTLLTFNIGGYLQRRNAPMASIDNVFSQAFNTPPHIVPVQYASGKIGRPKGGENPWAVLTQTGFQRQSKGNFESVFAVEQDLKSITKGLKIKGIFSYDYFSENGVRREGLPFLYNQPLGRDPETGALLFPEAASDGKEFLEYATLKEYGSNSTYLEANLSYDQTINNDHYINALFLYNQRDYDNGRKVPYRNQGIAGRIAYTYLGRYITEFNFGYNGSENFRKGKRFGFFPSIALGWYLSEEPFMSSINNSFSKIKIRGSYGLVGNDRLDGRDFAYITTISSTTNEYQFGDTSSGIKEINGLREGEIGVPDLTWETVKKANLGLEIGLRRMIDLQVDFFHERREDIFIQRNNYPNSAGFSKLPWANYGVATNKGIDLSLDINKQITKDWFVSLRSNFTYAKNKIVEQDEDIGVVGTYRSSTGKPINQIFGLIAEGLFTEEDFADLSMNELKAEIPQHTFSDKVYPGDIKYKDLDGDGKITSKDMTAIGGTQNPEIVYGFGFNTSYKDFDFGVFFQGNARTYRMIGRGRNFLPGSTYGVTGNIFRNATDAWTIINPSQDVFYPRMHMGYNENNAQSSTWWLKDMSMLRLKNVELGYSMPKKVISKSPLAFGRVFLRATNLLQFSKFKLWDPELDTDNGLKYPIMETFSMGLQVRF